MNSWWHKRDQQLEEHRGLVACEIHDGACQYVAAAQMAFDAFRREHGNALPGKWDDFDAGVRLLGCANDELRRLLSGLRPIQLAAGDLPTAISRLIQEFREADGPVIEFCHDVRADQIPQRLEVAAFRIVQESVANAHRHSKSKKILVGLTQDNDSLCIQVQDWGVGFDAKAAPSGRFGLDSICQRAKLLQGTTDIHSVPGEGTLITVELPLGE